MRGAAKNHCGTLAILSFFMKNPAKNFAFIDGQNVNLSIQKLGWRIDWTKLRVYLREKYGVTTAYYFIGYLSGNNPLYAYLQAAGYILMFKPTLEDKDGKVKGNCDADLVLRAMIDYEVYDQAVLMSSDGDFYSLVQYLYEKNKLKAVISPCKRYCSMLLKKEAKEKIIFMDNLHQKLSYKGTKDLKKGKQYTKKHRSRTKP
jgi:uncharacterized LabA/DUF88 family protein